MSQPQTPDAIARIEAALARLEGLAGRPVAASGDTELAARHDALRTAVAHSLARLDALIESAEA
jgi:hypothetical protein